MNHKPSIWDDIAAGLLLAVAAWLWVTLLFVL